MMKLKIARPLLHASYRIGSSSKIEAVFVPWFEPLRFAEEGRWEPAEMKTLDQTLESPFFVNKKKYKPDTSMLEYAQAGARFTTTIGPADLGVQYYYGRLTRPSITFNIVPILPPPVTTANIDVYFDYNPYHQIGVDWAQVLFGFNVRAEFAANITEDLAGDDGAVYNPALLWSFGFDRDLFWGINLNIQCNESIRLMHNKLLNNLMLAPGVSLMRDIEADTDMTYTQIIAALSKKFFRDELELRVAVLWGIEDRDFILIPSLVWTKDSVSVELSGGIFGGDKDGQYGQYRRNSFIKTALTYSF
jgi:hypothetical protein